MSNQSVEIEKRADVQVGSGKVIYRIKGTAYRCQLRAVSFTHTSVPEADVSYTVWRLKSYRHPCTAYSAGNQIYHGDSLEEAWEAVCRSCGDVSPPGRLQDFSSGSK